MPKKKRPDREQKKNSEHICFMVPIKCQKHKLNALRFNKAEMIKRLIQTKSVVWEQARLRRRQKIRELRCVSGMMKEKFIFDAQKYNH